jgi:ribonucleoside-triphosphate reductase
MWIQDVVFGDRMKCPYCNSKATKVVDKRASDDLESNRRRRECLKCGKRFTTFERIEKSDLTVIKKDGRREGFDRNKIKMGITKACEKRPINLDTIEKLVDDIETDIREHYSEEVSTSKIGDIVIDKLKNIDQVAYVRFAAYYRPFGDVKSFENELKRLQTLKFAKKKKHITQVKNREGEIVPFDQNRITEAIWKAAEAVGGTDKGLAKELSDDVVAVLEENFTHKIPTVEEIQDVVEKVLIENGHAKTAKAYIVYREEHKKIRDMQKLLLSVEDVVDGYTKMSDWRVKENANMGFSFSGLTWHVAGTVMAHYALNYIYPKEISQAHIEGDFHLHDLYASIAGYCAGWSLRQLITEGYNGVPSRVESNPPKHLRALLGQMMNFLGTLQHEWAGAQAFSSFDTYLAPFVRQDNLSYKDLKQNIQELVFNLNIGSRWGGQTPFTNITLDWRVPEDLKNEYAIIGGKMIDTVYGDYQKEIDMVNKAFIEVMTEGDKNGRVFTFPIPTYNITKDFDWDSENTQSLFGMTGKYGLPYFQNFVNSDLKPGDVRAMCCRLQLNMKELKSKTGGLFGFGESTGSIGVVTINIPKIGYLSKDESQFFERLGNVMTLAKNSLEIKRKVINQNLDRGLLPYTKRYLGNLNHHFSTIGLIGMNEACLNFLGQNIATKDGKDFAIKVLKFMREKLLEFQNETGHIFNLEATPAEGTSFRLARIDKKKYPNIITAGKGAPYYTNSTHLPVNHTSDIFEALNHQDELQTMYTGGTVFHGFIGERIEDSETCALLAKRISHNYRLPYFTVTPTFSICPVHGYISGEHFHCPHPHTQEQLNKFGVKMGG